MSSTGSNAVTKAGLGYTVSNILIRGIGFLTLPIFSRLLAPDDFGIYNIFMSYDAMLFCVVGLSLHSSVKSANWEFPGKIDQYVSSILIIYVAMAFALLGGALLCGNLLMNVLGLGPLLLAILVIHSFGTAIVTLYNARVSLQYSYKKYMVVAAISSLGNVMLSLLLIFTVFNAQKYMGRVVGATIAVGGVGVVLLARAWGKARPEVSTEYWRFGLKYSLPIVPHGISQIILSQFSRIMVGQMVSTTAAGIFSLAANLMLIMTVLTDSISTVWTTWFYEIMEGESADSATRSKRGQGGDVEARRTQIQRRAGQLVMLFGIVAVGLMTLAPELIWILGGPEYADGIVCAYGLILSGFCVFIYNLLVVGEYYMQKTGFVLLGTAAAAGISVALNLWCISSFGYQSAAFATLAAYVFYCVFHWAISFRLIGFSIIPVVVMGGTVLLLACCCVTCLFWADAPLLRIALGGCEAVVLALVLVRSAGGLSGVRSQVGR